MSKANRIAAKFAGTANKLFFTFFEEIIILINKQLR